MIRFSQIFGAPTIDLKHAERFSESVPNIIIWAAPVMFFFVLLEMYISHKQHRDIYTKKETIASTLVGIGSVLIGLLLKFTLFCAMILIYNMIPWRMALDWWTFLPCYIIYDFFSYWAHRISHEHRFWWATHIVHHSAEDYNLSVSFRLSWVQHLKIIFFLPVALLGFHPIVFFVVNQIAVLFQFWVHTDYIRRMPRIIELIFATPSNHRVHHGSQDIYINKNYGATFIIWDRLFGTYQPEVEQAIYGLNHKVDNNGNPIHINFQEFVDIYRDIRQARGLRMKWFFLFGNPIAIARYKDQQLQGHR